MTKKKKFLVKNKLWIWPTNQAAWYFVYVDGKVRQAIEKIVTPGHAGMVKIEATIGDTSWQTSLFPHKKESCYLLPVKKSVRQAEGIFEGDMVKVEIRLIS